MMLTYPIPLHQIFQKTEGAHGSQDTFLGVQNLSLVKGMIFIIMNWFLLIEILMQIKFQPRRLFELELV